MKSLRSTIKCKDEDEVLRTLSEDLPVGVCIMQDGRFCYVNPAFPVAIGYTMDELIGKDSLGIVVPEDREIVREKTIKMLKGELLSPYQFRAVCKDGSIVWVMATVKPIQYHGRPAILGNYMEITGRKQMEEALKERERRYRELADSITDVFFAMDEDLRYTYWNKASEILTGIRAEDAIGKSLQEIFPDASWRRKAEQIYRKVVKTQRPETFVNDYYTDGRRYILEINTYPSRGGVSVFVKDITEQRQTEDAWREVEEEKSALLEEAPVAIIHTDLKGEIIYVNQRFESESGYSRGEVIGKSGFQLGWFPAGTLELLEKRMMARLAGSPAKHWETQFKCKDGRWIWIELEGKILRRSGFLVGFQIIATNITERKQAEEALRRSEERYRTILEEMEEGYYEVDIAGNFTFVNDAMCRMLGYSRHELIGMNYKTFTPKEDIKTIFKAYNGVYRTGEPLKWFPMVEVRRDGTRLLVEDSVLPVRNDGGEIIGFRGISRDVTERRQAEEALRQSEERYRTILEEMEDAYFEVDLGGHLTFVNNSVCRDLGYSSEELMGRSYKAFTVEEDIESVFRVFNDVYQTGVPNKGFPWKTTRKDGSHGFAETSISLLRNNKDEIIGFRGIGRDITERRRMEEALQAEKNKLQSIIDAMQDDLTIQDTDYDVVFQNEPARISAGGDRIGEKCYRAYEGNESICADCPVEKSFRDCKSHISERQRALPSGEVSFWETISNPVRDASGRIVACLEIGRNITERKKQEQALADELTRRRIFIDQSLDGIVVLDVDAKVIEANQRFAEMLGYTLDEVYELHTWDWDKNFPPEKILEMGRNADEEGLHLETKHTRKDGSLIDVDISINGAMCAGQKLIFCVCRDVTARKQADEALQQSEEKYRALFDSTVIGTIVIDAETLKVMMANQAAAKLFGFCFPKESIGADALDFLHPEDKENARDIIVKELFEQDLRQMHELRVLTKNGREIWVSVQAARIMHEGRLAGLLSFTDITEHKRMEEEIKLAAEQWKKTFDSIIDGVSIHDRDFRILQVNKAFTELFQRNPSQIIGRHCYELHNTEKPHSGCPHQQTLATGNPAAAEFYESHLKKFLRESTAPILNERGEVVATVHLTRDVTEQKLHNERLMMTDRLASLGELASGAAHELNNPLTSIIGFSQLLMEKEVPGDIREDLRLINTEAQRAASVTKNLLTFARKQTPVKEPNQINNIIEDVLRLRAYEHKANGIEVERQFAADLPEVMVDYFQMQQVFMNIIINAEYFMINAHGRGTLTITSKKQNNTVMILFTDDGPGIPPDNLTRIFDPFFTSKEAGKGTGLGLSICHGIVTEHGGQIYARSQLGKGATIVVELRISGRRSSRRLI